MSIRLCEAMTEQQSTYNDGVADHKTAVHYFGAEYTENDSCKCEKNDN